MTAYAQTSDLTLRAGRLAGAWTSSSTPSTTDLATLLADAAAAINGVLSAFSITVPITDPNAAAALRALNAKMALVEALRATFPGKTGPQEAAELIDSLTEDLYGKNGSGGEWGLLLAGKHAAEVILIEEGAVPQASSFWTNEPDYGEFVDPELILTVNPQMLPMWSRLSRL